VCNLREKMNEKLNESREYEDEERANNLIILV
jgi:hypothetical protein